MSTIAFSAPIAGFRSAFSCRSAVEGIKVILSVRRQRLALRRLDDANLADLGLSRAAVAAESARFPWDLPFAK